MNHRNAFKGTSADEFGQLLAQVMKLSYFPQIRVIHTSRTFHGQLYIPVANWLLMIGTILVASIYNNVSGKRRQFPS